MLKSVSRYGSCAIFDTINLRLIYLFTEPFLCTL